MKFNKNKAKAITAIVFFSLATLFIFQNFTTSENFQTKPRLLRPYMISGQPTSITMPADLPFAAQVPLKNNANVTLSNDKLRFIDFYKNVLFFGMHAGLSYFYLWDKNLTKLQCEGDLLNNSGIKVPSSQLSHVIVGSFDGSGHLQVFGLHRDVSWYYIWDLGPLTSSTPSCQGKYSFKPIAEGHLYNYSMTQIPGDILTYVIATDWNNDGTHEIQGFQKENAWSYIWSHKPDSSLLQHQQDMRLQTNVDDLRGITVTRRASGWSNVPYETQLYLQTDSGYELLTQNGSQGFKAACSPDNGHCANKTIYLSLDQAMVNGPINSFRTAEGRVAVNRLLAEIATQASQLRANGIGFAVLVNPGHKDKPNLIAFLDRLAQLNIPFVLDLIASDVASNLFTHTGIHFAHAPAQALSLDVTPEAVVSQGHVLYYQNRYKDHLKGFRIFEQLAPSIRHEYCRYFKEKDPTLQSVKSSCWRYIDNGDPLKAPFIASLKEPYRSGVWKNFVRNIARIAKTYQKTVLWSDNHHFDQYEFYHRSYPKEFKAIEKAENLNYRAFINEVAAEYPGVIIPAIANNEGTQVTQVPGYPVFQETPRNFRLETWPLAAKEIQNILGIALSNQSWLSDAHIFWDHRNLPPHELAGWTTRALIENSSIVQYEPLWYFFNWPSPKKTGLTIDEINYSKLGMPNENWMLQIGLFLPKN